VQEGVKKLEAADQHGFARIKQQDLSVPIRVDPRPEPIFPQRQILSLQMERERRFCANSSSVFPCVTTGRSRHSATYCFSPLKICTWMILVMVASHSTCWDAGRQASRLVWYGMALVVQAVGYRKHELYTTPCMCHNHKCLTFGLSGRRDACVACK